MSAIVVSTTSKSASGSGCTDGISQAPVHESFLQCDESLSRATLSADAGSRPLQPWIQKVSQPIAEQIDAEHREKNAQPRKQRKPPRGTDIGPPVGEHAAPGRDLRWNPKSEDGEGRFRYDRRGHRERTDHNRRLEQIGHDVAGDDAHIAGAQSSRRLDELAAAQRKRLAAGDAAVRNPALHHQREDEVVEALAEERHDGNGQKQRWESPDNLDKLLDQEVDRAREIAGDGAQSDTDYAGDEYDHHGDDERNART